MKKRINKKPLEIKYKFIKKYDRYYETKLAHWKNNNRDKLLLI